MKKMHIRIKRDGKTEIRVEGAEGHDCLAFTHSVEKALGVVETREMCVPEADPLQVQTREQVTDIETAF
jgi:hypothetical protein